MKRLQLKLQTWWLQFQNWWNGAYPANKDSLPIKHPTERRYLTLKDLPNGFCKMCLKRAGTSGFCSLQCEMKYKAIDSMTSFPR